MATPKFLQPAVAPPGPALPSPGAFGGSIGKALDAAVAAVPPGKSLAVSGGVTTTGAEVAAAWKKTGGKTTATVGGYAGYMWGGAGYTAGVRATFIR